MSTKHARRMTAGHGCDHAAAPSPTDALRFWISALRVDGMPSPEGQRVGLNEALGRVTAEAVWPLHPSPRFTCAAMDGVAVRAADSHRLVLMTGQFDRIDTGDPLPYGRDAVVPIEQVQLVADGTVLLQGEVAAGAHVRPVGEDIPGGEPLLPAGHRLRAIDLAAIGAAGRAAVVVRARPRVAIVPTGDELRPVGAALAPGEIADTNSLMLAHRVDEVGGQAAVLPIQPDDPGRLRLAVTQAADGADLVLILSGSSVGRGDHTSDVIDALGSVLVRGVAVRPAHPTVLGILGERGIPVIGVPGYPAAAMLAFDLFAMPLLALLEGTVPAARPTVRAVLGEDVSSRPGVEEWIRLRLTPRPGLAPIAYRSPGGGGALRSLVQSDALLRVDARCAGLSVGSIVDAEILAGAPAIEHSLSPAVSALDLR